MFSGIRAVVGHALVRSGGVGMVVVVVVVVVSQRAKVGGNGTGGRQMTMV
jgi:hypothetical protein